MKIKEKYCKRITEPVYFSGFYFQFYLWLWASILVYCASSRHFTDAPSE